MDLPGHSGGGLGDSGHGGVKGPGSHSLRHSYARHWLQSGLNVNAVSAWLGHSSLTVTLNTYLVLAPDTLGGHQRGSVTVNVRTWATPASGPLSGLRCPRNRSLQRFVRTDAARELPAVPLTTNRMESIPMVSIPIHPVPWRRRPGVMGTCPEMRQNSLWTRLPTPDRRCAPLIRYCLATSMIWYMWRHTCHAPVNRDFQSLSASGITCRKMSVSV